MKGEYYINQSQCNCFSSPYFSINNLFRELKTEKQKRIARLNLGVEVGAINIYRFIEEDKILPINGPYVFYYNENVSDKTFSKNSKVVKLESISLPVDENQNIQEESNDYENFYCWRKNRGDKNNEIIYFWRNDGKYENSWNILDENFPKSILRAFKENIVDLTYDGLMSHQDKVILDNIKSYIPENASEDNKLITKEDLQLEVDRIDSEIQSISDRIIYADSKYDPAY